MEKLNDLRFIIGLFFAIIGALLVVLAFALSYEMASGKTLNLYAGLAMLVFGLFMLWMKKKN
jgi:putative Ca2+/H+ antiporter (TMEM165/GDT1 family)